MAALSPRAFEKSIADGRLPARIFIFAGDDAQLKAELFRALRKTCGIESDDPFRLISLDSDTLDKDPARLADELGAISMFGGTRLVRAFVSARHCQGIVNQAREAVPGDWALAVDAGDLADASWLTELRSSPDVVLVGCNEESAGDFYSFVRGELERFGVEADDHVVQLLISLIGEDRSGARGEIEKLALLLGASRHLGADVVRDLVADNSAFMADELAAIAFSGDTRMLAASLDRMRTAGADSVAGLIVALQNALRIHRAKVKHWNLREPQIQNLTAADIRALLNSLQTAVLQTRLDSGKAGLLADRALLSLANATRPKRR